ncbi:MAG: hypothetical protein K6G01_08530 [Eubacterium sp.]|nr:hypothetical protein [Eubacterium sp.]
MKKLLIGTMVMITMGLTACGSSTVDNTQAETFTVETAEGKSIQLSKVGNESADNLQERKGDYFCIAEDGSKLYYQKDHDDYAYIIRELTQEQSSTNESQLVLYQFEGFAEDEDYTLEDDMKIFGLSEVSDIDSVSITNWTQTEGGESETYYEGKDDETIQKLYDILYEGQWINDSDDANPLNSESDISDTLWKISFQLKNGNEYVMQYYPDYHLVAWYYGNKMIVLDDKSGEWIDSICE